jgi:hypothetical protein
VQSTVLFAPAWAANPDWAQGHLMPSLPHDVVAQLVFRHAPLPQYLYQLAPTPTLPTALPSPCASPCSTSPAITYPPPHHPTPQIVAKPDSFTLFLLDLSHNLFSGKIPAGITTTRRLQWLLLRDNQLTMEIVPRIGNLTYLQVFDFLLNQFSSAVPII